MSLPPSALLECQPTVHEGGVVLHDPLPELTPEPLRRQTPAAKARHKFIRGKSLPSGIGLRTAHERSGTDVNRLAKKNIHF